MRYTRKPHSSQLMRQPAAAIEIQAKRSTAKAHQSKNFAARLANILNGKQVRPSQFDGSSDASKKKCFYIYIYEKPSFSWLQKRSLLPRPALKLYFIFYKLAANISHWFDKLGMIFVLPVHYSSFNFVRCRFHLSFSLRFAPGHAPQRNASKYLSPCGFWRWAFSSLFRVLWFRWPICNSIYILISILLGISLFGFKIKINS